jgi:hypothetical protein
MAHPTSIQFGFFIIIEAGFEEKGVARTKPFIPTKVEPLKAKVKVSTSFKGKSKNQPKHTHDVKCFRY